MKRKVLLLLIIIRSTMCLADVYYNLFSHFMTYEQDGKFGIIYNDEIVVYPRFDELRGIYDAEKMRDNDMFYLENKPCIFAYKMGGKWGLMNSNSIVTQPIFDDILPIGENSINHYILNIIKKDGKWGIVDIYGKNLIQPIYERRPLTFQTNIKIKGKILTKIYILVNIDEKYNIFDLYGNEVVTNSSFNPSKSWWSNIDKLEKEITKGEGAIHKDSRITLKEEEERKKYKDQMSCFSSPNVIEYYYKDVKVTDIKAKIIINDNHFGLELDNQIVLPCIMDSIGDFNDNGLAYYKQGDWYGFVNQFGFIMPNRKILEGDMRHKGFTYACAYVDSLYDNGHLDEAKEGYEEIIKWLSSLDYNMPETYSLLERREKQVGFDLIRQEKENKRQRRFQNIMSLLNSLCDVTVAVSSVVSSAQGSTITSNQKLDRIIDTPKYSLTTNYNKRVDSYTYSRYDTLLSKMRYGNMDYNDSERKQWQDKMKELREKWEKQGERFQHSQNEDWNGK